MAGRKVVVLWVCAVVVLSVSLGSLAFGGISAATNTEFVVTETVLSDDTVTEGEDVDVTATVENTGDEEDEFLAELEVDGDVVQTDEVEIDDGESEEITFTEEFGDTGEYDISVNGEPAGRLTVVEPAEIVVSSAELDETEVGEGDEASVTAIVENEGSVGGSTTVALWINDYVEDEREIELDGGASTEITFTKTFNDAGVFDIAVNEEKAGTVDVLAPADINIVSAYLEDDEITEGEKAPVIVEIENAGDETGTFTAELEIDGKEPESGAIETELKGGDTETVRFEEPFDEAGEYGVSVDGVGAGTLIVNQPAIFETVSADLFPEKILEGSSIDVIATVENVGDEAGEQTVILSVDGEPVDSQDIDVGSGETKSVEFSRTFDEAGSYEIDVNGASAGTVNVVESAKTSIAAKISTDEITEGESVDVTADVENVGEVVGIFTVELLIDGDAVDSEEVFLFPRETETVYFNRTFDEAGEYNISVNNGSAGTLTVLEPANIVISSAELNDTEVSIGEETELTAAVENRGDKTGTDTVELDIDGSVASEKEVELGPEETDEITFTRTFDEAGEYDLSVNGTSAGKLTVTPFAVVGANLSDDRIEVGESVDVTATVENRGKNNGTFEAKLEADGETTDRKNETIAAGEAVTIGFERSYDEPGEFALGVSGTHAGVLGVEAVADEGSSPSGGGGAGGGAVAIGGGGGGGGIGGGEAADGEDDGAAEGDEDGEGDTVGDETGETGNDTSPESTDNAVTISADDASGDSVVHPVDLPGPSETEPVVSLSTIEIDPGDREQFGVTIARPTADPGESSAVPRGEALAYIDLETDLDANGTTSLHFEINRAELPEGLGTEDVRVMRYVDGEWTASGVTHDINGTDHRATLSRATSIAVVALEPGTIEIVDADVPADWVRAGSETTAGVTVRNTGDRPKTRTLAVTMDGEIVAKRNVSLDPGETASFQLRFEPPDSGAVMLDGTEISTLTVGEDYGSTSESPETTDEMSGFDLVSIAFALLVVTLIVRVRRA